MSQITKKQVLSLEDDVIALESLITKSLYLAKNNSYYFEEEPEEEGKITGTFLSRTQFKALLEFEKTGVNNEILLDYMLKLETGIKDLYKAVGEL